MMRNRFKSTAIAVATALIFSAAQLHAQAPSDTQKSLKDQATATSKKLSALKGAAFDKAYAENEVAYHQQVIDAVSKVLIPNAKNAELKSALTGAAPLFQGHLEHAKQVQSGLESGKSTTAKASHKGMSHKH